jgi:hypothetical protein
MKPDSAYGRSTGIFAVIVVWSFIYIPDNGWTADTRAGPTLGRRQVGMAALILGLLPAQCQEALASEVCGHVRISLQNLFAVDSLRILCFVIKS